MTKKRASRHRHPTHITPRVEPISERYQAEIDHSMSKLTRRYEKAKKSLEALERAEAWAVTKGGKSRNQTETRRMEALIEQRRAELREIQMLMMPGDYTGSGNRPVPNGSGT